MEKILRERYFLGSLTNVGNVPFRRLLKSLGAPVTISEMVVSFYAAKGGAQDLALMKKHESEDVFGVQIEGSQVKAILKSAHRAVESGADFIDFNAACPHASVIKHGAGAYLLTRPERLRQILHALKSEIPLPITLKIRKGYKKGEDLTSRTLEIAHEAGLDAVFLHARTKDDQYKGDNDWECIERVARESDIPVVGCGDIAHGTDALERMSESGCAGVAIARGALHKPWIFQEIKEKRLFDPSSQERIDMLKTLVIFTLEHFGDDARGLKTSRKFLHKQMSFLTRYVPIGAAGYAVPMQSRVNEWEPRDPLEALWFSKFPADWDELLRLAEFPLEASS